MSVLRRILQVTGPPDITPKTLFNRGIRTVKPVVPVTCYRPRRYPFLCRHLCSPASTHTIAEQRGRHLSGDGGDDARIVATHEGLIDTVQVHSTSTVDMMVPRRNNRVPHVNIGVLASPTPGWAHVISLQESQHPLTLSDTPKVRRSE
jgi:hypothetical protein